MTNTETPPVTKSQLRLNSMKRVMNSKVDLMSDLTKHAADYEASMIQAGMKVEFDAYLTDLRNSIQTLDAECEELSIAIGTLTFLNFRDI